MHVQRLAQCLVHSKYLINGRYYSLLSLCFLLFLQLGLYFFQHFHLLFQDIFVEHLHLPNVVLGPRISQWTK